MPINLRHRTLRTIQGPVRSCMITESNADLRLSLRLCLDRNARSAKLHTSFDLSNQTDFELVLRVRVRGAGWTHNNNNNTAFYTDMNGVTVCVMVNMTLTVYLFEGCALNRFFWHSAIYKKIEFLRLGGFLCVFADTWPCSGVIFFSDYGMDIIYHIYQRQTSVRISEVAWFL